MKVGQYSLTPKSIRVILIIFAVNILYPIYCIGAEENLHLYMAKAKKQEVTPIEGKEKTSVYLKTDQKKALKYIMYKEEKTFTDIVDDLIEKFIAKWEKDNGPIPK